METVKKSTQKLTVEGVCTKFNDEVLKHHKNEEIASDELDRLLKSKFNSNLAYQIKKLFSSKMKNGKKFFRFPAEPIYMKRFEPVLEAYRQSLVKKGQKPINKSVGMTDKECIAQLQKSGYQIQKPIGFDEVRFANEHPDLYKQYMLYGEI